MPRERAAVVDCSAVAALLFGEPAAETVVERLADARLVAPSLIRYELVSVCVKKASRARERTRHFRAALLLYEELAIEEGSVPLGDLFDLAESTELTPYDAAYLWLARDLRLPLVTLDRVLARAARALSIETRDH